MNALKIAIVQMNCVPADKIANFEKAAKMIAESADMKAQLIILPELFSTGYMAVARDRELAEAIPGPTTEWLTKLAIRYHVYVVAAIIEKDEAGTLYDTAVIAGPEGYVDKYRKIHLWGTEPERFARGATLPVFKLPFATIGLQICYEIGFPEPARILAQAGAEIIVYTSAFGKARAYAWNIASRSRALENGVYVLACNRIGTEEEAVFGGLSRVVAPNGDILASASADAECVISAVIDLDAIAEQRRAIPYLRDLNFQLIMEKI